VGGGELSRLPRRCADRGSVLRQSDAVPRRAGAGAPASAIARVVSATPARLAARPRPALRAAAGLFSAWALVCASSWCLAALARGGAGRLGAWISGEARGQTTTRIAGEPTRGQRTGEVAEIVRRRPLGAALAGAPAPALLGTALRAAAGLFSAWALVCASSWCLAALARGGAPDHDPDCRRTDPRSAHRRGSRDSSPPPTRRRPPRSCRGPPRYRSRRPGAPPHPARARPGTSCWRRRAPRTSPVR
jgi:hypothetical protein